MLDFPSDNATDKPAYLSQVTSMVATGPRPPMTMGGGGDEPLKISIGEGMMGKFELWLPLSIT